MSVSSIYNNSNMYELYKTLSDYNSKVETAEKADSEASKLSDREITKEQVAQLISAGQKSYNDNLLRSFGFSSGQSSNKSLDGFAALYDSLSTLDLMRSGTYSKLVKSYYASLEGDSSSDSAQVKSAGESAAQLNRAAKQLSSRSLFQKVDIETENEDGSVTVTNDYDRGKISSAVKSFVESYNKTIEDIAGVNDLATLRKGVSMVGMTNAVSGMLAKVGVTIGEDNQLSVDEEKLSSASMSDLKALFEGNNSYASIIAQKAAMVANRSSISGYDANGSYNYTAYTSGLVSIQT